MGLFQGQDGGLVQEELENQQKGKGWPGWNPETGNGSREEGLRVWGAERRGCSLPSSPAAPCPLPVHSTSEAKKGRSGVSPGVVSPLESRSEKKGHFCVA